MYDQPADAGLSQGDITDDCPILVWKLAPPPLDLDVPPEVRIIRIVVLTQACDLAQDKTTRVVVAPVHGAAELVAKNILKAGIIRDQVRRGQVFGWYFLPAAPAPINLAESIVDLRELHTIENAAPWSISSAPASASAAYALPGASTWPNISALPTRALPCPSPTPRSRDGPAEAPQQPVQTCRERRTPRSIGSMTTIPARATAITSVGHAADTYSIIGGRRTSLWSASREKYTSAGAI